MERTLIILKPDALQRGIIGEIITRFERVGLKIIDANVPLSNMFGYATNLRSMSQGRASYTMEFAHYTDVPSNVQQQIIEGKIK